MLADPFTTQTEKLVQCLDGAFPDRVKVGGLASGGTQPGENALFLGDKVTQLGLVGVALSGNIEVEAIVAQGCRPVGNPMFVTRAKDNLVLELDGRSPAELLEQLYGELSAADRSLFRMSLFVGLVMREDETEYAQGDFLVRNLVGLDEESGALSVAADVSDVRIIQFHLRDASTSAADLDRSLTSYAAHSRPTAPAGALMFSCLGRGQHLYGEPDHDSRMFRQHLGPVPLGGFFCNGEIGPVRARTYLHGYTSSFGIFRPAR
jgi:small ligand-binding sensory domain FIST